MGGAQRHWHHVPGRQHPGRRRDRSRSASLRIPFACDSQPHRVTMQAYGLPPLATSVVHALGRSGYRARAGRLTRAAGARWVERARQSGRVSAWSSRGRGVLVEVLVPVPALRRLHARRAAVVARAVAPRARRPRAMWRSRLGERELRDPGAAGVAVVHEDRRLTGRGVQRHRHAADVPPVADREEREQPDERVLGRVHRAEHLGGSMPAAASRSGGDRVPARPGGSVRGGRSSGTISIVSFVDARLRWYARTWFVTSTEPRWAQPAPHGTRSSSPAMSMSVSSRGWVYSSASSAGVEERDVLVEVEPLDPPLPTLVEVERARMGDVEARGCSRRCR